MDRQHLLDALIDPANRTTEATIQSSVRDLLVHGGLDLAAGDLATLEAPSGTGRIDIEIGNAVIEVKKKLASDAAVAKAVDQLAGYVTEREQERQTRIVGILTDGLHWSAWHLPAGSSELAQVDAHQLPASATVQDLDLLCVWLDGLMATTHHLPPTPSEVERRLGAATSATRLDLATLNALLEQAADQPDVALKRELWRRLLTVAFGVAVDDTDDQQLFLEHTYLVVMATLIGHAIIGYQLDNEDPSDLLRGRLFTEAGVYGVIEQDFFDWVGDVEGGLDWVRQLARRIGRFDWAQVDHDVLKVLYESVIGADTRHKLGEYYTPDWLARQIVRDTVDDPATQRVLDPACGSGTFLFWTVRHILDHLEQAGTPTGDAIKQATTRVYGMDVHPVAVTLARITYLLAIGQDRLTADRGPFSVPVFLGDSVQFEQAEGALWSADGLIVHAAGDGTASGGQTSMFAQQLHFPQRVIDDVGTFDRLIADLTDKATNRPHGSAHPTITPILARHGVHPDDQAQVTATFDTLCQLNDDRRNHIWGYYLRNLARPRWLAQPDNRVDRLVGNPPWLSYRHMPTDMQRRFRTLATGRGLWAGGQVATQQDLSALFTVRTCELYLHQGGRFGFVVPFATLSRQAYAGFRTGKWVDATEGPVDAFVTAHLDQPWQLNDVTPDIFPVPSAVVFGTRPEGQTYSPLPATATAFAGKVPADPTDDPFVRTTVPLVVAPNRDDDWSPYHARFYQGATVVPRALTCVEAVDAGPLGTVAGRTAVRAARSTQEKKPWKDVPTLTGQIEDRFLRPMHLGSTVLPFRLDQPWTAVVPWDDDRLLDLNDPGLPKHPGLEQWLTAAEKLWNQHRAKSAKEYSLPGWTDYQRKLTSQFPALDRPRVVYSTSGTTLAATVITDPRAIVDSSLYWAAAASLDEARYLTAVLNAPATTERVRPLQSIGAFGPRHFHKWVWALPIPHYDKHNPDHQQLVGLAIDAETIAAATDIVGLHYPKNRAAIRNALDEHGILAMLDTAVTKIMVDTAEASGKG